MLHWLLLDNYKTKVSNYKNCQRTLSCAKKAHTLQNTKRRMLFRNRHLVKCVDLTPGRFLKI